MVDRPTLYVVATPIGNLEDITIRAVKILQQVKFIAAEDTRQSKKLLNHYSISTPVYSLHAHNEKVQSTKILEFLSQQESMAYITDAGTPLISDPGAYLVQIARQEGFAIVPIPGPCAAIAALSVSGFAEPQFYFEGFLPHKSTARKQRLIQLKALVCTLIFYESPHRIIAMLEDLRATLGDRKILIARELTKRFETILFGELDELLLKLKANSEATLGEFVVLVTGNSQKESVSDDKINAILAVLLEELPLKKAVKVASEVIEVSKNELYKMAIALKDNQ